VVEYILVMDIFNLKVTVTSLFSLIETKSKNTTQINVIWFFKNGILMICKTEFFYYSVEGILKLV